MALRSHARRDTGVGSGVRQLVRAPRVHPLLNLPSPCPSSHHTTTKPTVCDVHICPSTYLAPAAYRCRSGVHLPWHRHELGPPASCVPHRAAECATVSHVHVRGDARGAAERTCVSLAVRIVKAKMQFGLAPAQHIWRCALKGQAWRDAVCCIYGLHPVRAHALCAGRSSLMPGRCSRLLRSSGSRGQCRKCFFGACTLTRAYSNRYGLRQIDAMLITHAHADGALFGFDFDDEPGLTLSTSHERS
jgi:hypothetical protein